jgi:hypothetical protein
MSPSLALATSLAIVLALSKPSDALGISFTPFGPNGEGGTLNGQSMTVGAGGEVVEVDAFVAIDGVDLNGGANGTAARLSSDALPVGLDLSFAASRSEDDTDLSLTYTLTNGTGLAITDLTFSSFLDAEIDEATNTFFNEYAELQGATTVDRSFEVDEPGFAFGDIVSNLELGTLDGANAIPLASPDDVSMALSFGFPSLGAGQIAVIEILISEDGDLLGPFAISHRDLDPSSTTVITYSGSASVIPEPTTALLLGLGLGVLASSRARSS